jgi:hypothetical protein
MNLLHSCEKWDHIPIGRAMSLLFYLAKTKMSFSPFGVTFYSKKMLALYREYNGIVTKNHFYFIPVSVWFARDVIVIN